MIPEELTQAYDTYTGQDQQVWRTLFERQTAQLHQMASARYLEGLQKIGFRAGSIPNFSRETSPTLKRLTGWEVKVVAGLVSEPEFFSMLEKKQFPSSRWLRTLAQLDYLEEPDMFHDTFGHLPLLTDKDFCRFLSALTHIAIPFLKYGNAVELIKRLYWYTVEFGLIRENGQLKAYGGGLISSIGECRYALLDPEPSRVNFHLTQILATPVRIDTYQPQYFIIDSFDQLSECLGELPVFLEKAIPESGRHPEMYPVIH